MAPFEAADYLLSAAEASETKIAQALRLSPRASTELECLSMDIEAVAWLGQYYQNRILSATHLEFYRQTYDHPSLSKAYEYLKQAAAACDQLSRVTEKHYGYVPEYIRMGVPRFRWRDEGRSLRVVDGWTLNGRTMRFGSRSSGCGVMSVRASRSRWHIEQYFQRSTDDLGLDHFEGRSWRGFHHHFVLSALAYLFILTVYLHRKKILVRRGN